MQINMTYSNRKVVARLICIFISTNLPRNLLTEGKSQLKHLFQDCHSSTDNCLFVSDAAILLNTLY